MGFIIVIVVILLAGGGLLFRTKYLPGEEGGNRIEFRNIAPKEAKEKLAQEKNILLLDVRTEAEYREKHIPGSTLIPLSELENEALLQLPDKDQPIIVYCRSGNRSVTASKVLTKLGYTQVYNLGGINQWPYETETGL